MKRIFTLFGLLLLISGVAYSQTISAVTTTNTTGSYKIGDVITVRVTFSAAVDVVGSPRIQLNVTPTTRYATTSAVTNVTQVNFTYTIQSGDVSSRLDYASATALTLNGGTIFAQGTSTPATLTLPATASNGLYTTNLIVDGIAPTGYSVAIDQAFINNANKAVVSFTFTGAEVGATYSYSIDDAANAGTTPITGTGTVAAANSQITGINTTTLDDGTLTLTVYLTDAAGNQGGNVTNTKAKDVVAPTGYSVAIDQTSINNANKAAVSFTFTGAEVGTTYSYSIDDAGNAGTAPITGTSAVAAASSQIAGINTTALDDGTLTLTVYLTDAAGNQGGNVTNTKTKDVVAPNGYSVAIDQAAINNSNKAAVSFTFTGAEVGATYNYSIDDAGNAGTAPITGTGTVTAANMQITGINTTTLDDGTLTLTVHLTDLAGNQGGNVINTKTKSTTALTAAITRNAVTLGSFAATTDNSISYAIVFNKPINPSTFTTADIAVTQGGTTASTGNVITNPSADNQNFVYTLNSVTGDGTITITVGPAIDDTDGNSMAAAQGPSAGFTMDNTAPAQPGTPDLVAGSDSGTSNTDNITNVLSPQFTVTSTEAGATVRIFSSVDAGSRGNTVASGTTTTVNTSLITQGNGQTHNITAVQTDAAGNPSTASSALTITLDATKPAIASSSFYSDNNIGSPQFHNYNCNGALTNEGSVTEFFHIILTEALAITDGNYVTVGATSGFIVDVDGPGATAPSISTIDINCEASAQKRGASVYHSAGNVIHLKSIGDNDWSGVTTVNFTANGSTNIKDVAGNEMATFTNLTPPDTQAPYISSGLVFNPNGSGPETITFYVSEVLNSSVGTTPTGFTVNQPAGGTVPTQSYNPATQQVTLTSASNGQWSDAILVSYTPGNVKDPANNSMAAFSNLPIRLRNVNIVSNNANNQLARPTNTVTLSYVNTGAVPTVNAVTIDGMAATVSGSDPNYTATLVTSVSNNTGPLSFQIDFQTAVDATLVTATTNTPLGSSVTFDKTAPTYTSITIASNGLNTAFAKPGNNVVVTFTVSETLGALPTATIDSKTATVVNTGGLNYTATVTTDNTYNNGTLAFSISAVDVAGNTGTGTAITSGSLVTFDKTPPVVASIASSSALKGIGSSQGIVATSVNFLVTFTETNVPLTGIDANGADFTVSKDATVNYTTLTVTGSGNTRTVTINGITGTGKISLGLTDDDTILDAASNPLGGAGAGNGSIAPSFTGTQYYTIALPEPTNPVASLTAPTATSSSVTVQWNQPPAGTQAATHYLVLAKPSVGSYPAISDGVYIADGPLAQNIVKGAGIQTATFSVSSGTSYDFIIYPYTLATNNANDNIDFKTTTPATVTGVVTNSASTSALVLNSTPVPISSIKDASGNSADVMQFTIYDDGLDPVSPNVMVLNLNGPAQESISFKLREELTLAEGANVTGFTSSTGAIASAIYSGKGTTNTITLTNTTDGTWTSASTTITYSTATGNVQFLTLGKMQQIAAHDVVQAADVTQIFSTSGSFTVPAGVTKLTVEAWGAGGSGGEYSSSYGPGSSGGGGGGAYSRSLLNVTPGSSYSYVVGAGGASRPPQSCCAFGNNGGSTSFGGSLVVAEGGWAGLPSAWYNVYGPTDANPLYTYGGRSSAGIGDVKYSGGQGGYGQNISPSTGGAGGSSAGINANGNNGDVGALCSGCFSLGGSAPAGGAAGGAGAENSGGVSGIAPGGGGGGTGSPFSSGAGANGQIKITYGDPTPLTGTSDWDGDNSPFKFSELIITQGAGNSAALSNWQNVIAGAELYDGTNTVSGTVNATNITFSSIPSTTSTDVGFVPDANGAASSKTYTLRIWLRNNLSNALASSIDGLNLAFKVDPTVAANLTYNDVSNSNQKSSRLVPSSPAIESGAEGITVVASKLVYATPGSSPVNTNPPAQIGVGIPFSANVAAQDPEVYALDANNNLDLNYNNSANLTNPLQTFGQSIASASFSSGKLSLNSFYFSTGSSTLANTRIVISGTGTPAVTAATSTDVWPRISDLTTIASGSGTEPATLSSLTTALTGAIAPQLNAVVNFDFTITDDWGANAATFADNDALPTLVNQMAISQGPGNDGILTDWTKAIAGAQLTLTSRNGSTAGLPISVTLSASDIVINATSILFNNIPFATATDPGRISDGGSNIYTLKIYLKTSVDPSIADLIDGKDFVFQVSNTGTVIGGTPNASSVLATSSVNSGDGKNTVAVIATKLDFITQWATGASQNYDTPLDADAVTAGVQSPVAKARDVNGNLDLGFNATVNLNTPLPATYTLASNTVTVSNGVLTFDPALKVTSAGNGSNGGTTSLLISSTGLTNGNSNSFILNYSATSDIILDAGFTHPSNVLYANSNNQVTDITSSTGTAMEQFTVREGGGSADADGTPTKVSSIVLNINNYHLLRRVALYMMEVQKWRI